MPLLPHGLRTRLRTHLRRWALAAATGAAALALVVGAGTAPASATDPQRLGWPAVAGSIVTMPGGATCTAGPVLQSRYVSLTNYSRNTRYILFAKHCAHLHDDVTIAGRIHGLVSWQSRVDDTAIITVYPSTTRHPHCSASSLGQHCTIIVSYTPQATGKVITQVPYSRGSSIVPVSGTGTITQDTPAVCHSGAVNGVDCGFYDTDVPATWYRNDPLVRCVHGPGSVVGPGDSGGPIVSRSGRLFGIILGGGYYGGIGKLCYFPLQTFLQGHTGYSLAPAD